jgi:hypothetical protein
MFNVTPRPLYSREREPITIVQEAGWVSGSLWIGTENLATIGVLTLDRPAHSESMYRLRHSARLKKTERITVKLIVYLFLNVLFILH